MSLACFDVGREIGRGSFAQVHVARHRATGQLCALKVMAKAHVLKWGEAKHVIEERKLLQRLSTDPCPFIIHLYGAFQDEHNLYLCMEYVQGGDLCQVLEGLQPHRFSEDVARFFAAQIILGLEHMHSRGICYRDLKPENIMLDSEGYLRLADLGFAKSMQPGQHTHSFCGTAEYMSPEALFQKGHSFETDFWSLGCVVFEMLSTVPPFYCANNYPVIAHWMQAYCESIRAGMKPFFPRQGDISDVAWDLICNLMRPDPMARDGSRANGGFQALKSHPWFKGMDWAALQGKAYMSPLAFSCAQHPQATPVAGAPEATAHQHWDEHCTPCFTHLGTPAYMEEKSLTESQQLHFVDF